MAEKRSFLNEGDSASDEKRRRPPFYPTASDALTVNSLQKLSSALEPLLRRVVNEEVERALEKYAPSSMGSSRGRVDGPGSKCLQLKFKNKLSLPIFTGSKIEGEHYFPVQIILIDRSKGDIVSIGPEASVKVEIVVLEGDFDIDEDEDWTDDDFNSHVVHEREGKRPLLTGDVVITLKDGIGTLGEISFTDNSSWIRSRKFRLGARIVAGGYPGIRIRGAKTEAFTVKDHRGELYKKHYPPLLHDEVWRLDKIGKDGAFHKRLNNEQIFTVQDFLKLFYVDSQKLRSVLGSGMSNKMWEGTVEHAKTCVPDDKLYVYYANEQHTIGIVFNATCQLLGLLSNGQYTPADELSDNEKENTTKMLNAAHQNWNLVVELKGNSLNSKYPCWAFLPNPDELAEHHKADYASSAISQQRFSSLTGEDSWLPSPAQNLDIIAPGQPSTGGSLVSNNIIPDTLLSPNLPFSQTGLNLLYESNFLTCSERPGLRSNYINEFGHKKEHAELGMRNQYTEQNVPELDWKELYHSKYGDKLEVSLDEQGLDDTVFQSELHNVIQLINTGRNAESQSILPDVKRDEAFPFSVFTQSQSVRFSVSRDRLSGRASRCWLKLKAAFKWGISVRKVVAERRARLEEIG